MEAVLIDIGALGAFLVYVAIVYWHAVSHEARLPASPRTKDSLPQMEEHCRQDVRHGGDDRHQN